MTMKIKRDDLSGAAIAQFLEQHIADMKASSPPESKHALDLEGLKRPEVSFWIAWDKAEILGCVALLELDATQGELKSMRTGEQHRGKGVGAALLEHVLQASKQRNYKRVSLETGAMDFFKPAHALYAKYGFKSCAPFANYWDDPNSVFMSIELDTL